MTAPAVVLATRSARRSAPDPDRAPRVVADANDLRAAGLYDPASPDAPEALNLLRIISARGGTIAEMREARARGELVRLAADLFFMPSLRRYTLAEAAHLAVVDPAEIQSHRRAAGLPLVEPADPQFTEADIRVATALRAGSDLLGPDAALQLLRVVSSSTARIADAAVSAFVTTAGATALAEDDTLVQTTRLAASLQQALVDVMEATLRQHLVHLARPNLTGAHAGTFETARLAVGFVDVISSTALAEHLPLQDVGRAILDFESVSTDVVTAHGGRVVKFVGDEVMYRTTNLTDACAAALELLHRYRHDPVLPGLRAGVAFGDVLVRDGDCFGPVVNLAARAVKTAGPSKVRLATKDRLDSLGPSLVAVPVPPAHLPGITHAVSLFDVDRAN